MLPKKKKKNIHTFQANMNLNVQEETHISGLACWQMEEEEDDKK